MGLRPITVRCNEQRKSGYSSVDERGAALVELAIVLPVIVLLVLGCIEFGLLFSHASALSTATRAGARMATTTVDAPTDDYDAVQAVLNSSGSIKASDIERIVVYKADGTSGPPSTDCINGLSVAGSCNVYTSVAFSTSKASFSTLETAWPPSVRKIGDQLGVYVRINHNFLSSLFGSDRGVSDQAVMTIQPSNTVFAANGKWYVDTSQQPPPSDPGSSGGGDPTEF